MLIVQRDFESTLSAAIAMAEVSRRRRGAGAESRNYERCRYHGSKALALHPSSLVGIEYTIRNLGAHLRADVAIEWPIGEDPVAAERRR
jgi:hypothetical protein